MCNSAAITPFVFGDHMVRVQLDEEGDPWFVAKDVCRVLAISNHNDAVSQLDDDEKGVAFTDPLSEGGQQQMRTISESGLYALAFRSRKPEAKRFSKWVRAEVLPSLRKTGSYNMPGSGSGRGREWYGMNGVAPLLSMARNVKPHLRAQLMNLSVRMASMTEEENQKAMHIFGQLCGMHGSDKMTYPGPAQNAAYDQVKNFADEMCIPFPGEVVTGRTLYNAYVRWCSRLGRHRKAEISSFGGLMTRMFAKEKRGGNIMYLDVALKPEKQKTCQG